MGDESDTPDAPDYSEVIGMLKDVFKVSGDRAKELWDWGKQAYETNMGIGRQGIENALAHMNELAADADKYRAEYAGYAPAREKQLADAMAKGTTQYQEQRAGQRAADVALKVKAAREAAMQRLEGLGIAKSAMAGTDLGTRVIEAGMQAEQANVGREEARKEGEAALATAIGTGEGVGNRINPAAAGSAQMGNQAVNIPLAIDAGRIASSGATAQQTGLAAGAAGNIANVQNMGFTNQMDKYNADQASPSGWDILGTGLGLATKFIPANPFKLEEGGAIPDPTQLFANGGGPVPPELSPSGGAIPDDIDAQINGTDGSTQPAQINAGEFIFDADTTRWIGEKQLQKMVAKAQQEMSDPNAAPAQPELAAAGGEMPPPTMDGAGIPPLPAGVV